MEREKAKEILRNLGYSEWEIAVYLALVTYGPLTAQELSRLSRVARSKTYEVVTRLRIKGLVMKIPPMPTKGITQKFAAMSPDKVFPAILSDIKELSTFLTSSFNKESSPRFANINFYTSHEGVKKLFYNTIKKSKFFYFYLTNLKLKKILGYSFEQRFNEIKKKKHYFILSKSKELEEFSKQLKNYQIKNFSFIDNAGGLNYIITSQSIILDLWASQHIFIEILSKDSVETFLKMYEELKK